MAKKKNQTKPKKTTKEMASDLYKYTKYTYFHTHLNMRVYTYACNIHMSIYAHNSHLIMCYLQE